MIEPVYQSDRVTLYCGDCVNILPQLGPVDMLLTDPPYGTQNFGGGYGRWELHAPGARISRPIANDTDLSAIAAAFPLCLKLIDTGWAFVFYSSRMVPEFVDATMCGKWFGEVIWDKKMPGLGYHIRYSHESIGVFRIGEPERPKDTLFSIIEAGAIASVHPHEKPQEVLLPLIKYGCKPGGIVLDPFMGSGTTGVAAIKLGCKFIGIEIDPKYTDIAIRRIKDEEARPPLFSPVVVEEKSGELF
jgi:DNA modification methylase